MLGLIIVGYILVVLVVCALGWDRDIWKMLFKAAVVVGFVVLLAWGIQRSAQQNRSRIQHLPSPQRQEVESIAEEDVGQPSE